MSSSYDILSLAKVSGTWHVYVCIILRNVAGNADNAHRILYSTRSNGPPAVGTQEAAVGNAVLGGMNNRSRAA